MSELLLEQISHEDLKKFLQEFYKYAKTQLNIDKPPKIFLDKNQKNADDFLGKTGYYDPDNKEIHLFITDRHAKDIVRSFAHELVHHVQNLSGFDDKIDLSKTSNPAYASSDPALREMERDAFERGNMLFRDWTDSKKLERKKTMAEMTKPQIKSAHKAAKKMMPSMKKQYGKRGEEVAYATAAKMKKAGQIEEMDEAAKPDFLDLDKDGDKKEPMKVAAKQAKSAMKKEGKMKIKVKGQKMEQEGVDNLTEVSDDDEEELDVKMSKPTYKAGMSDFAYGEKERGKRTAVDTGEEASVEDIEDLEIDDEESAEEPAKKVKAAKEPKESLEMKLARLDAERAKVSAQIDALEKANLERAIQRQAQAARQEVTSTPSLVGKLPEQKQNPYPVLFEQRERLLNEAFSSKEERVYGELVKRFIKK